MPIAVGGSVITIEKGDIKGVLYSRAVEAERVALCGVGNDLRGDDGVGVYIAESIMERVSNPRTTVINCGELPENYIPEIQDFRPDIVVLFDAASVECEPGTIVMVESEEIYGGTAISTHRLSLSLFSRILRSQLGGQLDIFVMGVQVERCDFGAGLSDHVEDSANAIIEAVAEFLAGWRP